MSVAFRFGNVRTPLARFAATLVAISACGSEDVPAADATPSSSASTGGAGGDAAGGAGSGGGGAPPEPIVWEPCPNITEGFGSAAECAEIPVPLFWDEPEGETIVFFVKRYLAAEQPSRAQVWFLQGGPGLSVVSFETAVPNYADADPTLDIYLPEHRGVGMSTRLGCPEAEGKDTEDGVIVSRSELPTCIPALKAQWGDRLNGFTTSNAARDLGDAIARTRTPDQQVFVAGTSYGTHWAHRYLQIHPEQPTGIALLATAIDIDFWNLDPWLDGLGEKYFDACGADSFCASKLGPDPWLKFSEVMEALDAGACPEAQAVGVDRAVLRRFAGNFLYSWHNRTLIPPLVYRIDRCSPADVAALEHFAAVVFAPAQDPAPASERFQSNLLFAHVALSELWPDPAPSATELQTVVDGANAATEISLFLGDVQDSWPRYPPDAYVGQLVDSGVPMLMLHGEMDFIPASSYGPAQRQFIGASERFVLVPRVPHNVHDSPSPPCTRPMLLQFLADPSKPVDTSCIAEIVPLSFEVDLALSQEAFGTIDAWEGVSASAAQSRLPPSEDLARAIAAARSTLPR